MLGKGLESLISPTSGANVNQTDDSNQGEPIQSSKKEALDIISASDFSFNQNSAPASTDDPFISAGKPLATDFNLMSVKTNENQPDDQTDCQSVENSDKIKNQLLSQGSLTISRPTMEMMKLEEELPKKAEAVFQIEIEKIKPNPYQPRRFFDEGSLRELANSIREFGIIQPLVLSKILKEIELGTEVEYQLIAGERRLLAAKMAGLRTVPAIIRIVSTEREKLEMAVIENIQRLNLNPIETARSYAKLQDEFGLTQREIASRLGKSRETIANTVRLLGLPSEIQAALEENKINESQARLLLQIDDIARQREIFRSLLDDQPTVRELRQKIKQIVSFKQEAPSPPINPAILEIKNKLEEALGTKVNIRDEGDKGKVVIDFYSLEELSHLTERLIRQNDNQFL